MEIHIMTEEILGKARIHFDEFTKSHIKEVEVNLIDDLKLKKEHSLRVAELCCQIAQKQQFEKNDCRLAELIGLVHDMGRFPQYVKYQTFDDSKSEDHTLLGIKLLEETDFFKELSEADQHIVKQSIESHNKLTVTAKDKRTMLFCQILRDANKLDIWDMTVSFLKKDGTFSNSTFCYNLPMLSGVSDVVIKTLSSGKVLQKKDLQSINDYKLFQMSQIFDLNFKVSFEILNKKQLIKKIYDTLPKRDDVINYYRQIRLLIENKFVNQQGHYS